MMFAVTVAALATIACQAQDTAYARMVREATTDSRFLPASVAALPLSATVPSPLDHFGTIAGAPGVTHRSAEIYGYMRALGAASARVRVETVGTTEGGREIILVVVSDEANLGNLAAIRGDLASLADPRTTSREEMIAIAARATPVYYLQAGLHSPEMGSPEMVMELAYRLAVSDDPTIARIRSGVVTIINPVSEPDGRDRQVDWYYRYTRGRETWDDGFPRSSPYWGEYVFHDNNRDGLQISQAITRAMYDIHMDWLPTASLDLHESVPLLYVSTGTGPYNRSLDPIVISEWQTMSNWDVQALTGQGAPGVWTWGFYNGWWPGYGLWIANNHNGIGRFYETFGNAGADTYVRDLRGSTYAGDSVTSVQWYRPAPPTGQVRWSMRNNTNYMEAGAIAALDYASRNGETMLRNFWQKGSNSIQRGVTTAPHAFRIPGFAAQRDPRRTAYLVNQLMRHGIEVHLATDTLAGDFIVLLNQPYRDFAFDLLTNQDFPSSNPYSPYDDVAWTLGLMYGVEVEGVDDPAVFSWPELEQLEDTVAFIAEVAGGDSGDRATWLLRYTAQAELLPALYALAEREERSRPYAVEEAFTAADATWGAGTVQIENLTGRGAAWLARSYGLPLVRAAAPTGAARHELDLPRVAVYHTWYSTQADGWVRYWFDQLGIPYTSIHKDDLRAGRLSQRFDVIVVPDAGGDAARFINGVDARQGPMPYTATAEFPSHGTPGATDDMTGGPGFAGMEELRNFLHGGGTIVTLGNAGRMVAETGLISGLSPYNAAGLQHPGSLVRTTARRPDHPVLYGYPDTTHVFRGNFPLWRTDLADRGMIVLQYGTGSQSDEREPLADYMGMVAAGPGAGVVPDSGAVDSPSSGGGYVLSGMVRNSDRIDGQGAIFDVPAGDGRAVIFSFNPMHRFLNHHDAPLVLNALLNWND